MKTITIALLQLMPGKSIKENLQKGLDACRQAKVMGADIALFPEMWSTGYGIPENLDILKQSAIPKGGPFVKAFSNLARDTLILEAGEKEGIYLAEIPIEEIRLYRSQEVHGNAYRHPKKYGLLIDTERKEPFIREDYRGD